MEQDQPGDQLAQVLDENATLRQKLEKYKSLEEDLAAQRVFEKTKKLLTTWITLGGAVTLVAGMVGFKVITDYTEGLVKDRLQAVSQGHIEDVLLQEGKRKIADVVEKQRAELLTFVAQQKAQISISGLPLGTAVSSSLGIPAAKAAPLPAVVDYTDKMQPVRDSGDEGAVVGFAVAAAVEYQIRKTLNESVVISPRYIYYYAREKLRTQSSDSGAQIRDGISVVTSRGAVAESAWPYRAGEFAMAPPASVADARHYKMAKSQALSGLDAIKSALATDGPVVIGVTLYAQSQSADVAKTGRVPMPKAKEIIIGGHAICLVGYDDGQRIFKFRNSWGKGWGDKGYGYLPYDYVEQLSSDSWSIKL